MPNKGPCGGAERGELRYLASSGSRNYFQWKTVKAHKSANCTVSVSTGSELNFKTLWPRDESADFDGKFPCGRTAGFEGKEFRLPDDFECPQCILQFQQELSVDESITQCADFVTMAPLNELDAGKAMKMRRECGGVCQNGGSCQMGECLCRQGYEGQFCEVQAESVDGELVWFFIIACIVLLALVLFYQSNQLKKRQQERAGGRNDRDIGDGVRR